MIDELRQIFPTLRRGRCQEVEKSDLFRINDPEIGHSYIHRDAFTDEEERKMFIVHNANKTVYFIAIDKCLITEHGTRTCDFALFDDKKFAFVELKLNVTTAKLKSANDTREDALAQLFRTLLRFNFEFSNNGLEFSHPNIYVIVAMPPEAPRNKSTSKDIADFFLEKYGYEYEEARQIFFD